MTELQNLFVDTPLDAEEFLKFYIDCMGVPLVGEINCWVELERVWAVVPGITIQSKKVRFHSITVSQNLTGFTATVDIDFSPAPEHETLDNIMNLKADLIRATNVLMERVPWNVALFFGDVSTRVLRRFEGKVTLNDYSGVWSPEHLQLLTVPFSMEDNNPNIG